MHEATVRTVCRELGLVADTALPRLNQLMLLPEPLSTHDVEHVGSVRQTLVEHWSSNTGRTLVEHWSSNTGRRTLVEHWTPCHLPV